VLAACEKIRRHEGVVVLECPRCGQSRLVQARQARRVKAGEASGLCRSCCFGHPGTGHDSFVSFWLDRLDDQAIARVACWIAAVLLRSEHAAAVAGVRQELSSRQR
jgi:predicted RNA-binding Zn-ribbon protein involved in translation (DUF1610 family)